MPSSPSKSALAIAYSAKRANMKKKGYARGGEVEAMDDMPMEDSSSACDEIMKDRKMAKGGMVGTSTSLDESDEAEPAFEEHMDLEPVHTVPDEMHDQENPSEDDESLIGQILKDRRNSRRGL